MQKYTYKARDEEGKSIQGIMEAVSQEELMRKLKSFGYMPVSMAEELDKEILINNRIEINFLKRIKPRDMIMFNMQLSNMVGAGVTLLSSLNVIAQQVENLHLKGVVKNIEKSVASGSSFSEALSMHKTIFSPLFINMVKAGEVSGSLHIILMRLAEYIEKQEDLRQKVQGALFYPAILLIAGILVILLIVTFVMPQFITIFDKAGISLPLPSRILYKLGVGIKHYWYLIILGGGSILFGLRAYISSPSGRIRFDQFKLKVPLFGALIRQVIISKFTRTLGLLADSGVPLLKALDLIQELVGNDVFRRTIAKVRLGVEKGEKMSASLQASGEFPPDVLHMISVGEETGKLANMLQKIADFYDSSIDYTVKKLTILIEPIMISIMGGVVGFIMASILLPIFDMAKTIQR